MTDEGDGLGNDGGEGTFEPLTGQDDGLDGHIAAK